MFTAGPEVVLRIGGTSQAATADADWRRLMDRAGVRVPRSRGEIEVIAGLCVAPIERVAPDATVDWAAVGEMVRRLHSIGPVSLLPSCTSFPHWRFGHLLDELAPLVDEESAQALRACHERHRGWEDRATGVSAVALHGDVHPGNVVATASGPVLIDWDLRSAGPPAWDHAPLMRWTERWGGAPGVYEEFASGYGRSFRGDPLAESLAELRLLAATLMRIAARRRDPSAADELEVRLRWWREPHGAPAWTAQ